MRNTENESTRQNELEEYARGAGSREIVSKPRECKSAKESFNRVEMVLIPPVVFYVIEERMGEVASRLDLEYNLSQVKVM